MQVQKIQNNNNYNPNFQAIVCIKKDGYMIKQLKPIEREFKKICINTDYIIDSFEKEVINTQSNKTLPVKYGNVVNNLENESSKTTIVELANGNTYELPMTLDKFYQWILEWTSRSSTVFTRSLKY